MPDENDGRVEETGYYTFVRSRREVRANAARRLARVQNDDRPLSKRGKDELQIMADGLGLEVKGTGSKGRVIKKDLVKALESAETDAEGAGQVSGGGGADTAGTTGATGGKPAPNTASS